MMLQPEPAGAAAAQEEEEERRMSMRDRLRFARGTYQPRAGIAGYCEQDGQDNNEREGKVGMGVEWMEEKEWMEGWGEGGAGGLRQHPM